MNSFHEPLDAIAAHRVANRPGRFEPRKKKRRRMPYELLMKPRAKAKLDILKGVSENLSAIRVSNLVQFGRTANYGGLAHLGRFKRKAT